eukprot:scaffold33906_cov35-Phaeocystis_antarctica.AAC.1
MLSAALALANALYSLVCVVASEGAGTRQEPMAGWPGAACTSDFCGTHAQRHSRANAQCGIARATTQQPARRRARAITRRTSTSGRRGTSSGRVNYHVTMLAAAHPHM